MNKDMISALNELEKEKGISKDVVISAMETALLSGFKKNYGKAGKVTIDIDRETGDYKIFTEKTVVEEVEDSVLEISIEEAKEIDKKLEVGDIYKKQIKPKK
jgi:N utilization substance protein A